jgi:hypothetical protein
MAELYSNTVLAEIMAEVLEELVEAGKIPDNLAVATLEQVKILLSASLGRGLGLTNCLPLFSMQLTTVRIDLQTTSRRLCSVSVARCNPGRGKSDWHSADLPSCFGL